MYLFQWVPNDDATLPSQSSDSRSIPSIVSRNGVPAEILVPTIRIYDNVRGWENPSARLLITAKIKYVMYLTSLAAHKGILFTANKSVMDTKTRPSTARYRVIPIFKNAPATSTSSYRPGFSPIFFV